MKPFLTLLLFFSLITFQSNGQNIEELNKRKEALVERKNIINDSIEKIQTRINFLSSRKSFSEVDLRIATRTITKSDARIKLEPEILSDVIAVIPKGNSVYVSSFSEGYYFIISDSIQGHTSELFLVQNEIMSQLKKESSKENLIDRFGEDIANMILSHRVWIGMTPDMARLSLGSPKDINKNTGSWGVNEQWVYDDKYLYFENGKLTSWQE
ncbi:MAG: hypothetical protein LPK80_07390 [Bacteroidota bacterium]|nr:hypothetical protein [Bacteroidota bacterium]MDX5447738.1 hypothetical protein [Bacteroidota bacterium]